MLKAKSVCQSLSYAEKKLQALVVASSTGDADTLPQGSSGAVELSGVRAGLIRTGSVEHDSTVRQEIDAIDVEKLLERCVAMKESSNK